MIKYIKINWILFRNSYIRDSKLPGYNLSVFAYQIFEITVSLVFFNVLFSNTKDLAGWNFWQVVFLYAFSKMIISAHSAWTKRGTRSIAREMVRDGVLDFYLTKPSDPMFMVSINRPRIFDFIHSLSCLGLCIYAVDKSGILVGFDNLVWFLLLAVLAFVLYYFLQIIILIPVFWFIRLYSLHNTMNRLNQFMQYPAGILPLGIKAAFFTIFPIIAVSYVPARTLFYEPNFLYIVYMGFITFAFGALTRYCWDQGVRHYGSASS